MKGEILREPLLEVLKEAGHAVDEDATLPVLHCVYLELAEGRCRVMATDFEIGYRREGILAHVEESGAVVVGYNRLVDWLEAVSGDKVILDLQEETTQVVDAVTGEERDEAMPKELKLRCGRNRATLKEVFASDEWPVFPEAASVSVVVDAEDLVAMIAGVAWAAGGDVTTAVGGVSLETSDGMLRLVATDKCALSLWERPVEVHVEGKVVVPAESLTRIKPLLSGTVQICLDENAAAFVCDDTTVVVQTMDLEYYAYEGVVESARANPLVWQVETSVLRSLVRAGGAFARADGHPYLSLKWQPGDPSSVEMEIVHGRGDLQGAIDGMDGDVGKPEVHLGIGYLISAVGTMRSEVIGVRLADGSGSVYLSDVGQGHEVVIMPVQLTRRAT